MKAAGNGQIVENDPAAPIFAATLDASVGSSGSAVVDATTGLVEGVDYAGASQAYTVPAGSSCAIETRCSGAGTECTKSRVARATDFAPQLAHCTNGVKDSDETAVDCGGSFCGPCAAGVATLDARYCASQTWVPGTTTCAASCTDRVKDGTETDADCGGSCTDRCGDGRRCNTGSDCATGLLCTSGICTAPPCLDGVKDFSEGDVDCGGSCTNRCARGMHCNSASDCTAGDDCTSGVCSEPATCHDGIWSGDEGDVDCGGACVVKCANGKWCSLASDCLDGAQCVFGRCREPSTCHDGTVDGYEADVDCGGPCDATCLAGQSCVSAPDCVQGTTCFLTCREPATCHDGALDGFESDVDCGATCNHRCAIGQFCSSKSDCAAGAQCTSGKCH